MSLVSRRPVVLGVLIALLASLLGTALPAAAAAGDVFTISDVSKLEGNSGTTAFVFTVTRSGTLVNSAPASVAYATSNGSATAPSDYTASTGTLTFAAGDTEETITINVVGDTVSEPDETFNVTLTPAAGESCAASDCVGVGTIRTDDTQISVSNSSPFEGEPAVFTVTLSTPSSTDVTVQYSTADSSATAPADYTAKSGILTIPAGQTSATVEVATVEDSLDEDPDETFLFRLENPSANATIKDGLGEGTIRDDDGQPTVSVNDAEGTEAGGFPATFTVTLSAPSGSVVEVNYETSDGTGQSESGGTTVTPADYESKSGTLTFQPGETSKNVVVPVFNDTVDETSPETFTLTLSTPVRVTILDGTGAGTIIDDDAPPTLTLSDPAPVQEPESGSAPADFTVTLSAPSSHTITVSYATANDTAVAGQDYTATSGQLVFAPGETSKTISVPVLADDTTEGEERFSVTLTPTEPSLVTEGDLVGTGTITDSDVPPTITIDDATATEGDANAAFTVTLSNASTATVKVNYTTNNGTAVAPGDYATTSGTLTFSPGGPLTQTILVPIVDDATDEPTEAFTVTLDTPQDATIADGTATGTINDNDAGPEISIGDVSQDEGNSGTSEFSFTLTLSQPSEQPVTVTYATRNGSAVTPGDYTTETDTVTFNPGQVQTTIDVTVKGDTIAEGDETFHVDLSAPVNATIADDTATGTIRNDDAGTPSTLTINDQTIAETDAGQTMTFTVTRSPLSSETVTVDFTTVAGTATAGSDFLANSGTLTFSPTETSKTITIDILGDDIHEATETFTVKLSNPGNATVSDDSGTGTITDDEPVPTLVIDDVTVTEGDAGTTSAVFTVKLSGPSQAPVTVDFAPADATARAPGDYTSSPGTLTFAPGGPLTQTISVPVVGDVVYEGEETFSVNLSGATGATITDSQGIGTITDNESPPDITVRDASVNESDASPTTLSFVVELSLQSERPITVDYSTADGTAKQPGDYAARSGTVTFPAGTTAVPVDVTVAGDTIDEPDETVLFNLSNANIGLFCSIRG